jgi:hypothetical protein
MEREKTAKTYEKRSAKRLAAAPVAETEAVEAPTCAHHWVIASPNGELSLGRCKVCGAEKEFPNSAEDYLWERSVPQSRWTGRADTKSFSDGF